MKNLGFLFLAAATLTAVSCSTSVEETEAVEPVTYTLDAANSSLSWKGSMSPEYFHTGTVDFSEGSITMQGDSLTAGSFVIDMTTIKNTDLEDSVKAGYLVGHLTGAIVDEQHPENMFFQTAKYPTVKVKLGEYKDGKLATTLMILGAELTQDVPVKLTSDENGASIEGKFSYDFASLKLPGFQPSENGVISSAIEFDLNLKLTK
jgi:hypothetical protein